MTKRQELEAKVETSPENAEAHFGLAYHLHWELKTDFETARTHYLRAIELKPDYVMAHGQLATVCHNNGLQLYDEARDHYRIVLELVPTNGASNFNYARFLQIVDKDYLTAAEHYKLAVQYAPAKHKGLFAICCGKNFEANLDDPESALPFYEIVYEIDSTYEDIAERLPRVRNVVFDSIKKTPLSSWSHDHLCLFWTSQLPNAHQKYLPAIKDNGWNGAEFLEFQNDIMEEIGVSKMHARRIQKEIQNFISTESFQSNTLVGNNVGMLSVPPIPLQQPFQFALADEVVIKEAAPKPAAVEREQNAPDAIVNQAPDPVEEALRSMNLEKFASAFRERGWSDTSFWHCIDEQELQTLGVVGGFLAYWRTQYSLSVQVEQPEEEPPVPELSPYEALLQRVQEFEDVRIDKPFIFIQFHNWLYTGEGGCKALREPIQERTFFTQFASELGCEPDDCSHVLAENLTAAEMKELVYSIGDSLDSENSHMRAIIYYSGHGARYKDDRYDSMFGIDGKPLSIYKLIGGPGIGAIRKFVIMDCCRELIKKPQSRRIHAAMEALSGSTAIFYCCKLGDTVQDGTYASNFFQKFMKKMERARRKKEANQIRLGEILSHTVTHMTINGHREFHGPPFDLFMDGRVWEPEDSDDES